MKALIVVISSFALTTALVHASEMTGLWSVPARTAHVAPTWYRLQPVAPADVVVTQQQAVKAVQRYAPGLFKPGISVSARAAKVDLSSQKARSSDGTLHALGNVSSWVVTVTGFDIPTFGHDPFAIKAGAPLQRFHTAEFIVDAKSGTVLQATWG